jgi:hypothetical protein
VIISDDDSNLAAVMRLSIWRRRPQGFRAADNDTTDAPAIIAITMSPFFIATPCGQNTRSRNSRPAMPSRVKATEFHVSNTKTTVELHRQRTNRRATTRRPCRAMQRIVLSCLPLGGLFSFEGIM